MPTRRSFLKILAHSSVITGVARTRMARPSENQSHAGPKSVLPGWRVYSESPIPKSAPVWTMTKGILACTGTPRGYLYTERDYKDFTMQLQWRWPPGKPAGKGGVLMRMTGRHKIWPRSLEAQINAGDAGDFWGLDGFSLSGAKDRLKTLDHPDFGQLTNLKKLLAVEKNAGQWNQYEITAKGATVTLKINGHIVNHATKCDARPGKICITAEGTPIEFRAIRIDVHSETP